MKQVIENKLSEYTQQLKEVSKNYSQLANLRLLILLLGIGATYQWIQQAIMGIWMVLSIGLYIGFFVLVKKHQKVRITMQRLETMIEVNQKYLKRFTQEWQQFEDNGADSLVVEHPYGLDLDIVGPRSLFQKINATHTWYGKQKLIQSLLYPSFSDEMLLKRQKAIAELMHSLDFCQQIESIKQKKTATYPKALIQYATTEHQTFNQMWMKPYTLGMTLLTGIAIALSVLLSSDYLGIITTVLLATNLIVQYLYMPQISEAKGMLSHLSYELGAYTQILEILEAHTFRSELLQQHKERVFGKGHSAKEGIAILERLCNQANISYQPIAALVLNATCLWDFRTMQALEKWKREYGVHLTSYLETIGEIESLVSLAVLGHVEETLCFPLIETEGKMVEATHMGHPLIALEGRVSNDVKMDESIFIITGSNMSGKTTFLRTMGIHLVLAYAGAPVPAKQFRCSRMHLYTSMRIRDDLSEGISTFYAELTRIKAIVEAAKDKPVCFLIDEIFRGTNSRDRIIGAKSVLKGLQKHQAIGGMTTHDLEICQLEEADKIINYHFTEDYQEDKIVFDYLLKKGTSTTTNAKYLMRMVGIDVIE